MQGNVMNLLSEVWSSAWVPALLILVKEIWKLEHIFNSKKLKKIMLKLTNT